MQVYKPWFVLQSGFKSRAGYNGAVRYVPEVMIEGGTVVTFTNFSIFDFCGMKDLGFEFGHDIFNCFKMASP